jgi:hypothetical protein
VHDTGFEPVHAPFKQLDAFVHALPSSHVVPSVAVGFVHVPVDGWHVPAVWHWSLALQMTGLDPVQFPSWQVYVWLHRLLPVHVVPSVFAGFEHPVAGLHVPALWH